MTQQNNEGVQVEEIVNPVEGQAPEGAQAPEASQESTSPEGSEESNTKKDPFEGSNLGEHEIRRIKSLRGKVKKYESALMERDEIINSLRSEFQELKSKIVTDEKPTRDKYDNDEQYIDELSQWNARKILHDNQKQYAEQVRQQQEQQMQMTGAQQKWLSDLERIKSIAPDFDSKMKDAADMVVPEGTSAILRKMGPQGASLYYHLLGSKEAAQSLWEHDGDPQGLEFELSMMVPDAVESVRNARNPKKPVSSAPAPAPKLAGNGGAKTKDPYDPTLTTAQRIELLREMRLKGR